MPTKPLPQDPDLDQLRRQAKDLHRAALRHDPDAWKLIATFLPGGTGSPDPQRIAGFRLSDAQLVIARHYGFPRWSRLRHHVEILTERSWRTDSPPPADEPPADRFLRLSIHAYRDDRATDSAAARQILLAHPGLPAANLAVAAVCGDVDAVRTQISSDPSAAGRAFGPYGWSPLLYQAYARHPGLASSEQVSGQATLDTARLLLESGADPNDGRFWHGLPTPFTVLTGVFGGGEHGEPPHPHAIPFARLLLDAGADPNDGQALYNRMFSADDDHLVLLFEYGLGRPLNGPWHRLLGDQLESPAVMLRNLLAWAITHDQRERVALLATHSVDIRNRFTELRGQRRAGQTPTEMALTSGHREMADLLMSLGAAAPALQGVDAFVAAAMTADTAAIAEIPPEIIRRARRVRPGLPVWAAAQGVAGSVELLAAHGFDVNALGRADLPVEAPWQTALHVAAERGDRDLATRLLDLGADPAIKDRHHHGTPADWARHFGHPDLATLLDSAAQPADPADPADGRIGHSGPATG